MTYLGDLVILVLGLYAIYRITQVPVNIQLRLIATPADESTRDEKQTPDSDIPKSVLDYIALESEEWARIARKQKAKRLFAKTSNWSEVLTILKQEDQIIV